MIGDAFDTPKIDDPVERTRAHVRQELPKRFYKSVEVSKSGSGFQVTLDGRAIRTPGGKTQILPNVRLCEAVAEEWRAQKESINPATMPLTRLVNSALDGVADDVDRVRADIVNYAGNDLLLYRAESPEELAELQAGEWDPIVAWAESELAGRFVLAAGIVHVDQPPATLAAFDEALRSVEPLPLAAIHVVTTMTGSALLALAVLKRHLSDSAAWAAAHLDEDWNMKMWGRDEEALARREKRLDEYRAAVLVLLLVGAES